MIKNLLDADENPPPGTKVIIEETTVEPTATIGSKEVDLADRTLQAEDILEIPATAVEPQNVAEISRTPIDTTNFQQISDETFVESSKPETENFVLPADQPTQTRQEPPPLFQTDYKPESQAETMRNSGLAYAAAITLFGAVVFMMVIGWFADLLLGSSPWGIVVGIVLGATIGFIQFFRLTSQILKNKE
jgi:hypothetical protein